MNITLILVGLAGAAVIILVILAVVLSIQNRQAGLDQIQPGFQEQAPPHHLGSTEIPPGSGSLELQVRDLLDQGRKIEAVKAYRDATGVGLKEAKETVEALERGTHLPGSAPEIVSQPATVMDLLRAGNKIDAIRVYKQTVGCSLKEAKEAVDAMERSLGLDKNQPGAYDSRS